MSDKGTQFFLTTAKARFHEGVHEFKDKNYGQAFALFTEATRLDPDYANAFSHLGILGAMGLIPFLPAMLAAAGLSVAVQMLVKQGLALRIGCA